MMPHGRDRSAPRIWPLQATNAGTTVAARHAALWLFLTFSVAFLALTRGHFIGTDEIGVYQTTRSLWERGDLNTGVINNSFPGRDGRYYSQYGVGQAVAALPLYALGRTAGQLLAASGSETWLRAFAGPQLGTEPSRWGGDVEIFFVNLYNCFATAALCAVFFLVSLQLGARARHACMSAILLGCATYVAPFATGFLRHTSEALAILLAFHCLLLDASQDSARARWSAGIALAVGLHMRMASVIAWPALAGYLVFNLWSRRPASVLTPVYWLRGTLPFLLPLATGVALAAFVAWLKFGAPGGSYNNEGFTTPLWRGVYGLLFSPGAGLVFYSPLVLLVPWLLRSLWREARAGTVVLLALLLTYLAVYGRYTAWHGLWSAAGPRYLMPLVPLLLLPLARYMEQHPRATRRAIAPLAGLGALVQASLVAVSFAFVYHHEGYPQSTPPFAFLFSPTEAPLLAHLRALSVADYRVDMWLVNVYREAGLLPFVTVVVPLTALFLYCAQRLHAAVSAGVLPAAPHGETGHRTA